MEELFNQIKLEIYERCENGLISEEEKDILLEAAEEKYKKPSLNYFKYKKTIKEGKALCKEKIKDAKKFINKAKSESNPTSKQKYLDQARESISEASEELNNARIVVETIDENTTDDVITVVTDFVIDILKEIIAMYAFMKVASKILISTGNKKNNINLVGMGLELDKGESMTKALLQLSIRKLASNSVGIAKSRAKGNPDFNTVRIQAINALDYSKNKLEKLNDKIEKIEKSL